MLANHLVYEDCLTNFGKIMGLNKEVFTIEGIQAKDLKEAQIEEQILIEIFNDYNIFVTSLQAQAGYFSDILHMCSDINSVKWRIKDPVHLLLKIVRKRKEAIVNNKQDSSKYMNITVENYKELVNDLIGLRAIYLFKAQWKLIDKYVFESFKVCHDEDIIIYHGKDDDISHYHSQDKEHLFDIGDKSYKYKLEVKESRYRSTHYIIEGIPPNNYKFELQTRTILEEAWGEIDHHIRYPNYEEHPELSRKMAILNSSISSCEEHVNVSHEYYINLELSKAEKLISEEVDSEQMLGETFEDLDNDNNILENQDSVSKDLDDHWDNSIAQIARNRDIVKWSKLANLGRDPFDGIDVGSLGLSTDISSTFKRLYREYDLGNISDINYAIKELLPVINQPIGNSLNSKLRNTLKDYNLVSGIDKQVIEALRPFNNYQEQVSSLQDNFISNNKAFEANNRIAEALKPIHHQQDIVGSIQNKIAPASEALRRLNDLDNDNN